MFWTRHLVSGASFSKHRPLHLPAEGTELFLAAETAYNERVARVENQIIARLRDRLGTARNANEMFRVFSKFNALFVRPKVCTFSRSLHLPNHSSRFVVPFRNIKHSLLTPSRLTFKPFIPNLNLLTGTPTLTTCPCFAISPQ